MDKAIIKFSAGPFENVNGTAAAKVDNVSWTEGSGSFDDTRLVMPLMKDGGSMHMFTIPMKLIVAD